MKNDKEKLKKNLSIALAVYNEEENLSKCLESVKDLVDEIVIVDGGSSDKTVDIARKYGAKIVVTDNPPIFHINKQKAIDACSGRWILQLDADEIVTPELEEEIKKKIRPMGQIRPVGYYIPRKNFLLGRFMKKGGLYPDWVIRLFRKGKGKFPCETVHEQIKIDGEAGYLKNELIHNAYPSFSEYLRKANTYTSLTAERFYKQSLPINFFTSMIYIILIPLKTFFNLYFRHLGFFDGFPGFVWAFFSALHHPIAYIKYWEMRKLKVKPQSRTSSLRGRS